jgi:hypothetical protein
MTIQKPQKGGKLSIARSVAGEQFPCAIQASSACRDLATRQTMKQLFAILTALAFVAVAALTLQPVQHKQLSIERIKTDSVTHYATLASVGRCNYVEMVE